MRASIIDEIRGEQNFGDLIGGSLGLRKVMQQIKLVAPFGAGKYTSTHVWASWPRTTNAWIEVSNVPGP